MIDILMPRLSDTMTEGAIASWHKKPGDVVAPGDVLVEIETDKALMEHEAYEAGVLAEILVAEGANAPIGSPIARLDDGKESAPPARAEAPAAPAAPTPPAPPTSPDAPGAPGAPERRVSSPLVRRIARERAIDLATVTGTGPGGRIVRADLDGVDRDAAHQDAVDQDAVGQDAPAPTERPARSGTEHTPEHLAGDPREPRAVPFDATRQAIASRLTESARTTPTFTVTASADVADLLALRERLNETRATTTAKISLNDLLVRAAALALRAHPGVNASYSAEGRGRTLLHDRVHVGIAVASPAGLVVPVVRDADRTALGTIAATARDLISRAAERRLTVADMSDGTFTVSNLGMFGIDEFTAIINPPQGAILAVGAVRDELALRDGVPVARPRLRCTLTSDHRIIDGALAAAFLATLTELLENPLRIVV